MSDTYIGFMDEEVRPVLDALQVGGWNVLVIERGNIDPNGVLFERPISAYSKPVMWKGWIGVSDNQDSTGELISIPNTYESDKLNPKRKTWLNVFQQCLYMNFLEVYKKLPSRILELEDGRAIKRKLGLIPSLSILYMGRATGRDSGLPTKILIRSPEMGMQPGLIRTQIRGILKSLKSASHATKADAESQEINKVNLWCYGAGGAYCGANDSPKGGPGKIWDTVGSLYIGVERDKAAENKRSNKGSIGLFNGQLSYCSDHVHETLYITPTFYSVEEARTTLEKTFTTSANNDEGDLLKAQIQQIYIKAGEPKIKDRLGISITSNKFIGNDIKKSALNYGLKGDVNMEDYHLFKLIHSLKSAQENFTSVKNIENAYPFIDKNMVIRIDADPATVTPIENNFDAANPETITVDDCAEIVKWGLEGLIIKKIPPAINWEGIVKHIRDKVGDENIKNYLIPVKGTEIYINPFLLETAQDLFRETGEWLNHLPDPKTKPDLFTKELQKNPFNKNIPNREELKPLLDAYKTLDKELKDYCKDKSKTIKLETTIEFIKSLYTLVDLISDNRVQIWARGGWGGNSSEPFITENVNFSGSNIDRALYKSNNLTVLDKNAGKAVDTYFK